MNFRKFPPFFPSSNRSSFKRKNERPFEVQMGEENAIKAIKSTNPSLIVPLSI